MDPKEIFTSMTPEAQELFLKSIYSDALNGDSRLLDYHEDKVGSVSFLIKTSVYTESIITKTKSYGKNTFSTASLRTAAVADVMTVKEAMAIFGTEIAAIGLPIVAEYALKAIAASIFVALADGAFVAGDAIAIVIDSGAALVLAFCADEIWRNRSKIKRAFSHLVDNAGAVLGDKINDAKQAVSSALNWLFAEAKSNSQGKVEGKISKGAEKDVKKKLGNKAWDRFKKALKKGLVGSTGKEGIKKLSGRGVKIGSTWYQYELKIFGDWANYRIYGNKGADGIIYLVKFGAAKH